MNFMEFVEKSHVVEVCGRKVVVVDKYNQQAIDAYLGTIGHKTSDVIHQARRPDVHLERIVIAKLLNGGAVSTSDETADI